MVLEQIAVLAAPGEPETLEFKETTGTRREATMTVCAFLKQHSGQVLSKALLRKLMTDEIRVGELDLTALRTTVGELPPTTKTTPQAKVRRS